MAFDHGSSDAATDGRVPCTGRIVVVVDGSQGSRAALEWAIREARVRASSVHILLVWQSPHTISTSAWGLETDPAPDVPEVVSATSAEAASLLGLKASAQRDVPTTWEAVEGNPVRALLAASEDADLLVVGSRRHVAFVGALVGAVNRQGAPHARCPVVVVPTPSPALTRVSMPPAVEDRAHA